MDEIEKIAAIDEILSPLSEREIVFVEHYCKFLSKKKAAVAAGHPPKNANVIGFNIYHRPRVKDAVKKYLAIIAITAEENIQLITRTAKTNLSDYFRPVSNYQSVREKVYLTDIVTRLKLEIELEDDFFLMAEGLTSLEKTLYKQKIKAISRDILKLEIQIRRNPKATRIEYVERLVTESVLSIEALIEDNVPLKSIKYTKEGVQVETYPADAAQDRLAKINGSFEADNKQLRPVINNSIGVSPEKLAKLTDDELKAMADIEIKLNA